jgi:hypothetical protein
MLRNPRFTLPISLGTLSLILMIWDLHNQRIITSMGMAWDTGAPGWPYQTADTLFNALNGPAVAFARPIAHLLQLLRPSDYIILYPVSILWWICVGVLIERQRQKLEIHKSPIKATFFVAVAATFAYCGTLFFVDAGRWWHYSPEFATWNDLILIRELAPVAWCVVLSVLASLAARRLVMGRKSQSIAKNSA